jgi:transcriptional regulator with XRE-family HTH domain
MGHAQSITASEVFGQRMREARERAGISQVQLSKRLAAIGVEMSRKALIELERQPPRRRVSLDEALAIAAALGVAPIHLMVPFEDDAVLSEELAEEGIFDATTELKVGNLTMVPVVARKWIRGTAIYPEAPLDELWHRFYCIEVPPAVRYHLRQLAAYARDHKEKLGRWKLPPMEVPAEARATEVGPVPGFSTPENRKGFPAPLWSWLMNERDEEENDGG